MPNLQQISSQLVQAQNHAVRTTNEDRGIPSDCPLYYSLTPAQLTADNAKTLVCATEDELVDGGQAWDMHPLIFYRINKPVEQ